MTIGQFRVHVLNTLELEGYEAARKVLETEGEFLSTEEWLTMSTVLDRAARYAA